MRKIVFLLSLFVVPLLLFLPIVNGAVGIGAEYPSGATDGQLTAEITIPHPAATAAYSAYYFTFMTGFDGGELLAVNVWMTKEGAPSGYLCSELYATTGTYGSTAVPTGAALERSIVTYDVQMSTLQAGGSFIQFNFTGTTALAAGTVYALSVEEVNETTCDVSNGPRLYMDTVGSYAGNIGWYVNGGWAASTSTDDDASFQVYVDGGDAVTYVGGNTYISQYVTNTTAVINGTITAGNITASGDVSVDVGGVTAAFNNTAVSAGNVSAGAVSAGAVTAGDVTAAGAVTFGGELSVNGTFDNATLTYVTSTAVSGDANVYFLIAFIALAVLLTFYNKVPLMNFLVGIVGISFITLSFANTDLPFWPYSSVLLALVSLLCMISGGFKMRNN